MLKMLGIIIGLLGFAHAQEVELQRAEVISYLIEGDVVEYARAKMTRHETGLVLDFYSEDLIAGNVYTAWWVIFNNPEACESRPCSSDDLLIHTDHVQANITYADGIVAYEDGRGVFFDALEPGNLPNGWFANAFDNPRGAEVHIVINEHGPAISAMLDSMTTTYRGGCSDESLPPDFPESALNDGVAGPNNCRFYEFAIFMP